jgi:hypothetical protein
MAPRLVLMAISIAFGISVLAATVTTVKYRDRVRAEAPTSLSHSG